MKTLLAGSLALILLSTSAYARDYRIGITMANLNDNYLTVLKDALLDQSKSSGHVSVQVEDAQLDVSKQISQISNFAAQKVDAIICNMVDTSSTKKLNSIAEAAGIPLVYVNRIPDSDVELPAKAAVVGSDEREAATLEGEELARRADHKGNVVIMMGELGTNVQALRTEYVEKVFAKYPDMKVIEKQTAGFQRVQAIDLMTNWISSGLDIKVVAANNDEMAIGMILALKQGGRDPKNYVIGGIDATRDALAEMKDGNLSASVFQDAQGQAKATIDAATKLADNQSFPKVTMVPFKLVTPANMADFIKN